MSCPWTGRSPRHGSGRPPPFWAAPDELTVLVMSPRSVTSWLSPPSMPRLWSVTVSARRPTPSSRPPAPRRPQPGGPRPRRMALGRAGVGARPACRPWGRRRGRPHPADRLGGGGGGRRLAPRAGVPGAGESRRGGGRAAARRRCPGRRPAGGGPGAAYRPGDAGCRPWPARRCARYRHRHRPARARLRPRRIRPARRPVASDPARPFVWSRWSPRCPADGAAVARRTGQRQRTECICAMSSVLAMPGMSAR